MPNALRRLALGTLTAALLAAAPMASARAPELTATRKVDTGSEPKAVVVSPDGKTLVVTNFGQWGKHNLYWYEPTTLKRIGETDFGKDGNAVEAVFSPDSKTVYVSNFNQNKIEIIDVATRSIVKELDVGLRPKIVILSADGSKLVVANWDSFAATIYDTKNWSQSFKLKVNEHPRGMAITRSGKLYVAGFEGEELDVYDGPKYEHHQKLKACKHVRHMSLSPDEKTLYLSCYFFGQLGVWDVQTDKMQRLVQIGQEPKSSAVSKDGRWVFVANFGKPDESTISVVDTLDWKQRYVRVPGMDQGCGLALSPDQKTVWVTGWTSKTLHAIDVGPLGIGEAKEDKSIARSLPKGDPAPVSEAPIEKVRSLDLPDGDAPLER
jgi:YVTN family beta-propeller protein